MTAVFGRSPGSLKDSETFVYGLFCEHDRLNKPGMNFKRNEAKSKMKHPSYLAILEFEPISAIHIFLSHDRLANQWLFFQTRLPSKRG